MRKKLKRGQKKIHEALTRYQVKRLRSDSGAIRNQNVSSDKARKVKAIADQQYQVHGSILRIGGTSIDPKAPMYGRSPNPKMISHFEIQAELYNALKIILEPLGYQIRGECPAIIQSCHRMLDLGIYRHEELVRVIEVKKGATNSRTQLNQYKLLGVPVDLIGGINKIPDYLKQIPSLLNRTHKPLVTGLKILKAPLGTLHQSSL
jgi:hypothetical protein